MAHKSQVGKMPKNSSLEITSTHIEVLARQVHLEPFALACSQEGKTAITTWRNRL